MNLALLLEMVAEGAPDRIVVGPSAGGFSAAELLQRARRAASAFSARGVAHVGLLGLNSEAVPIALFGAAIAGLPFAPVNYRLPDDQLHAILRRLAPATLVVDADMVERVPDTGLDLVVRDELLAMVKEEQPGSVPDFVDPDSIAILLFTSGTTGEPKAAVLRHRHLAAYILNTVEFLGSDESEAQLVSVPAYHVAGMAAVLSTIYGGRRIVYLPTFDPTEWLRVVHEEHITHAMVVPTMLDRILDLVEEHSAACASLRHLSYGGGRMPTEVIERAMKLLPEVSFVNAYGLTETSSTIAVLTPDDHREAMSSTEPSVRRRLRSVGRPLPTVEVEVRDPVGAPVPAGEVGEVYVRGEQIAGEYLGRRVLTDDGWFPTHDAGWLDDDGFLFLEGRLDDVIVRGGENLSPGEIEDTLLSHPAIRDAAVVGIPDPRWGEAVAAAVVLEDGATADEDELREWVKNRLRSTKAPQVIQLYDELPYNDTGKLLRRIVRDDLRDRSSPTG